jgi:hypothetical protein
MATTTVTQMNYVVYDAEGADWQSSPQVFAKEIDALVYLIEQNQRWGNRNPFVIRKLAKLPKA